MNSVGGLIGNRPSMIDFSLSFSYVSHLFGDSPRGDYSAPRDEMSIGNLESRIGYSFHPLPKTI